MVVKNRFQFLVALLLTVLISGILLVLLMVSYHDSVIQPQENVNDLMGVTDEIIETAISSTMTAKSFTATPTSESN